MLIRKAVVTITSGDGAIFAADVIEHEGKLWLVPTWQENPTKGHKKPERIICLSTMKHQKVKFGTADFVVNDPIPGPVLYGPGPIQPDSGFLVVMGPDVLIPIPRGIH